MANKEITLPELGEGVTEGELVKWLVQPGDVIEADQPVAELMTDKATVEVPSPVGGKVVEVKGGEGDVIEVGDVMLVLEPGGASASAAAPEAKPAPAPAAAAPAPTPAPAAMSAAGGNGGGMEVFPPVADSKVLATPHTRRLAREMNVDINNLQGSGVAGRVTREDVLKAKGTGATAAGPASIAPSIPKVAFRSQPGAAEERVALRGIRKKIAENMQMAKHVIPHFTLMDEANVSALFQMREELKTKADQLGVKVTYLPLCYESFDCHYSRFPNGQCEY